MTTPANTPPAVCPECGSTAVGRITARTMYCRAGGHHVPVTPSDEGRGTEPLYRALHDPRCQWRRAEGGDKPPCNCDELAPQEGGGEEAAIAKLRRMASGAKGCRDDYGQWVTSAEATSILAALAASQRREQEAERARGVAIRELVTTCKKAGTAEATAEATVARLTGELEHARDDRTGTGYWWAQAQVAREKAAAAEATLTALRSKLAAWHTEWREIAVCRDAGDHAIRTLNELRATLTPTETGSQG